MVPGGGAKLALVVTPPLLLEPPPLPAPELAGDSRSRAPKTGLHVPVVPQQVSKGPRRRGVSRHGCRGALFHLFLVLYSLQGRFKAFQLFLLVLVQFAALFCAWR